MPIPTDPLRRHWVELPNQENAELAGGLSHTVVGFMAFDRDRVAKLVGTGFILGGTSDYAAVMSAKHVVVEGLLSAQRRNLPYAPSALFVPQTQREPSLHPTRVKVFWGGQDNAGAFDLVHVSSNDTLDIACGVIMQQPKHNAPFHPGSILLDTAVPAVGDVVHMVSQGRLAVDETAPPAERDGRGQRVTVSRQVSIRIGTVTGVYQAGFRQYKWPCFTTSIPAEPGMSGGFVSIPRDGGTIAACGIVCADNSSEEARANFFHCGESVIASTWPALALRLPIAIPTSADYPSKTIFEMMKDGSMPIAIGGIDHISIVEMQDGTCRLTRT